jgi:SAM-dependent methyltransferase
MKNIAALILIKKMIRVAERYVKYAFYFGRRFECPCCNGHFRKMTTHPKLGRTHREKTHYYIKGVLIERNIKNAFCPLCGSDIRHRLGAAFLKSNKDLLSSRMKVLQFAPEEGFYYFFNNKKNIEYIPCDINPGMEASRVDITDIQFDDNSIDAIICNHVLEHIVDDIKAMKELYRVLKSNGWALITVPTFGEKTFEIPGLDPKDREKMYGFKGHVRLNGLDLKLKLLDVGFSVTIYSIDDVPGKYIDRNIKSQHTEVNKYLFFCKKL